MKCLQEALNRWLNILFSKDPFQTHKMGKAAQSGMNNNNKMTSIVVGF